MAELSKTTGVPVATIKFYLREGLLRAGERTGPNQAEYEASHLERLGLIRTLRDIGDLSISTIKTIVDAIENSSTVQLVTAVADALNTSESFGELNDRERETYERAARDIDMFLRKRHWHVRPDSPVRGRLVDALVALQGSSFVGITAESLGPYADAVEPLARKELSHTVAVAGRGKATQIVETMVEGTLLWERALVALRRAAEEHAATEQAIRAGLMRPPTP